MNPLQILNGVTKARDLAWDRKEKLISDHPNFDPKLDVRVAYFTKTINALAATQCAVRFWVEPMSNPAWWKKATTYTEADIPIQLGAYDVFCKIGASQSTFSTIESSIRALMRGIDSSAHAGGTSEFKTIYDDLLQRRLSNPDAEGVALLDVFRNIRNSIHNNGIVFHKKALDTAVSWGGRRFEFRHGKQASVPWALFLEIVEGSIHLFEKVVRDPRILGISAVVPDPASYV
jgi:hypothetical protein